MNMTVPAVASTVRWASGITDAVQLPAGFVLASRLDYIKVYLTGNNH